VLNRPENQDSRPSRGAARLSRAPQYTGRLTIELAAALAAHHTPVSAAERDELLALLEAMDMPTDPIAELNVQD